VARAADASAKPRDPAADAARIDDLTKVLLDEDYKARLKACSELVMLPLGSKAQEDLLLNKALPACAADAEWRLRADVARTVGNRFIWSGVQQPPDPRAVALCVKLAGDENAKVRYNAVYFGLSTVQNKSDEVLAALVKAAVASPAQGEGDVLGRVSWGLQSTPAEKLVPHVKPYLNNSEKEPRQAQLAYALFVKATKTEPPGAESITGGGPLVVEIHIAAPLGGDPKAALELVRKHVPAELVPIVMIYPYNTESTAYALALDIETRRAIIDKLKGVEHVQVNAEVTPATPEMIARITQLSKVPVDRLRQQVQRRQADPSPLAPGEDVRQALLKGDSKRREAILQWARNPMYFSDLTKDEAGIDVLEALATDPSPSVRNTVGTLLGALVWNRDPQHPRGIALAIKLSADPDPGVAGNAIYHGLSTVKSPMSDAVIRALVTAAMAREPFDDINFHGRIAWGLREEKPERLAPFFEPALKDSNFDRATTAFAVFVQATAHEPPDAARFAPVAKFLLWFGQSRDSKHNTPEKLLKAFRAYAPQDKVPEVAVYQNGDYAQGGAVLTDLALLREVAAKLKDDPEFYVENRPYVLLPRRLAALRAQLAKDPKHTISTINVPAMTYEEVLRDLHTYLGSVYPAFKIKNIDWKAVGDELLPLAKDVKSDDAFALLVQRMVARLEDSHAQVTPGSAKLPPIDFPRYDPGFACLIDDRGRPIVYHVDKGSPAERGGVKVGMTVLSVDGKPADDALKAWMDQQRTYTGYSSDRYLRYDAAKGFCRRMKQGDVVKVETEDVEGRKHAFELPATLDIRYLPRLPVPIDGVNDSGSVEAKKLGDGIGYIYVRRIKPDLPQGLDAALAKLGDIKGLIIDVRGNSGGGFDARDAFANFALNDAGAAPANASRPRYKGPIALLLDERCISAGEGWASWFIATKRARTFGTTTAGASARKQTYTLTNGMFNVVVPVKTYTGSLDRPIERRGLEPDVPVRCAAGDLAAGKDTVLETARAYLKGLKQK
jgi:C-terminal processing protease CtpA/Prc/HEAT repeat protein